MSDGVKIILKADTATPDLKRLAALGANMAPLLSAVGTGVVSLTKRAFNDAGLRPSGWAPKKDGSAATLKDTSTLWRSVRVVSADSKKVVVGSDRKYAAIHQLGGESRPMPARPFFPFDKQGRMTTRGLETIKSVAKSWVDKRGAI
jgi:phage gpG-like protein